MLLSVFVFQIEMEGVLLSKSELFKIIIRWDKLFIQAGQCIHPGYKLSSHGSDDFNHFIAI